MEVPSTYDPRRGDELIKQGDSYMVTDLPVDTSGSFDTLKVELRRPDGRTVIKQLGELREDMRRGIFALRRAQ